MVIKASRAVLTERCRLMCRQRGRQHLGATTSVSHWFKKAPTVTESSPSTPD
jgi:hypothetical protein